VSTLVLTWSSRSIIMATKRILLLLSTISFAFASLALGQIQPSNITMGSLQQQQFTAPSGPVFWMVRPSVGAGTITQSGLYTSPQLSDYQGETIAFIYAMPAGGQIAMTLVYLVPGYVPAPVTPPAPTPAPWNPYPIQPTQPQPIIFTPPNVTVSMTPGAVSLQAGNSATFTATVQGTTNTAVQWLLTPNVGTIMNGFYTAPSSITGETQVTVSAMSLADTTVVASSTITLTPPVVPVDISVTPNSTTLKGGQTAQFWASVSGTANTAVDWSLSPSFGSINNGFYTAPSSISSEQTVTLTATSQADPTKRATASLVLKTNPVATNDVSISLTPDSASLVGGQSANFTATVGGTTNKAVTWSLNPQVGTITDGVYRAPAIVASQQTVTITAASVENSQTTAIATVNLTPVAVRLTPAMVSLGAGASSTFTAAVTGSGNTGVNWSISPAIGTLVNGVYTAPASISFQQTVTLTATSKADPSKTATASLVLKPAPVSTNEVSISVWPTGASLEGGQSSNFTATVTGTTNQAVMWSMSPQVGTITNGVYQAPAIVASAQTVTIFATSMENLPKPALATIRLTPVALTLTPPTVSLAAGASSTFTAAVTGSDNTGVNWSMSPAIGTLVNGVYTAPATVSSQQTVTLTATSKADPTKTATASLVLKVNPVSTNDVSISLTPGSTSLLGGQSANFTATVAGTTNKAVTWSMSPQVGTITNGVYQAPAIVASQQMVTITAASVENSQKTAIATVTLTPIAVTLTPPSVSLAAGASSTFTAAVTGSGNTGVNWSMSPSVGTLVNGVYTAPASVTSAQSVTITAVSVVDPTKTATAMVTLTPSAPPPPSAVTLPLEVLGANGTTVSATVNIPSGSNLTGPLSLYMQIHGLRTETQASVQVNNSNWMPISDSTVTMLGNAEAYGGIGGGFHTFQMTMNLPAGVIQTGNNTINFRFNQTDGRVSGFRVLALNVQNASGAQLIPASAFVEDDPNTWQPPSTLASDISTGQTLWHTAALTVPTAGGTRPIQAHCMDCHAQDGRDLKYFNYSNTSIQARSMFHGLTATQGNQIASYIRSLNLPNPGRPWNPPYQPGPGLDEGPVENWSAGVGLAGVLNSDQDMMNAMFPSGVQTSTFSPTGVLSIRDTSIALQLPDWNSWLPTVHPMDAFSDFASSDFNYEYGVLHSTLVPGDPTAYANAVPVFGQWFSAFANFFFPKEANITNATYANDAYSVMLWAMVKNWELNQQFQLEGMAQTVFTNPRAESRAWLSQFPFFTSPNQSHISESLGALDNGSPQTWEYLAMIWYQEQLILNNSEYAEQGDGPIVWQYVYGKIKDLSTNDSGPQGALTTEWLIKAIQISNNGVPPTVSDAKSGWDWQNPDISRSVSPTYRSIWDPVPATTRTGVYTGLVQGWLTEVQQFTAQQFNAGGLNPSYVPVPGQPDSSNFADRVWFMIPQFRYYGVPQNLINQMATWAQGVWPNGNWAATTTATCIPANGGSFVRCSTE
jgi:hypothetical protein